VNSMMTRVVRMARKINKMTADDGGVVQVVARPIVVTLDLGLYALTVAAIPLC
jgi:hypothetical protein